VEMREMTEMNACFRRASRYRRATWSSKDMGQATDYRLTGYTGLQASDFDYRLQA
jgi:hypothetical protein